MEENEFFKLKYLFLKIKNGIKFRLERKMFAEQWFLIYDYENEIVTKSLKNFQKIIPPKDRFWADPFVVYKNNKHHIFYEEFIFKQKKGHISVFTIDKEGNCSTGEKILEEPFHLSYPFCFQFENEVYMIPETQEKKSIRLYKCNRFPDKWEFYKEIFTNIDAVDTTIYHHNDKWWMFTGVRKIDGSTWDNLHIFYSDSPISDKWISHPLNPIIEEPSNLRSAGSIFSKNNKIYRPVQISTSNTYGKAISINRIIILNEENFIEEKIKTIEPWDKEIDGIHTLNHENGLTVLDSKWKIKR